VYRLLGHPGRLRIRYRTGGHDPITDEHRKADLDWFDLSFGRGTAREEFPEGFLHAFDWTRWPAPLPPVIWLHPYSYASGYNEGYNVQDTTTYHRLAKEGFAVLAFDQCGFGLRLLEGTRFYDRYPRWSRGRFPGVWRGEGERPLAVDPGRSDLRPRLFPGRDGRTLRRRAR